MTSEQIVLSLSVLVVAGIAAQWAAWRLRIPSILLLLLVGLVTGPIAGLINPDPLLGDLLFPIVSLSVAIILFEGGLSLRLNELRQVGGAVIGLVGLGGLITWLGVSLAARSILGFSPELSFLLGAVLVVTGPTVTGPLLRQVRPSARLGSLLKWEGIVIDPVGASLAVLVFEIVLAGEATDVTSVAISFFLRTVAVGALLGLGAGFILTTLLRRRIIPDYLQSPVSLVSVIAVFALSNVLQPESGLLTVTVMGVTVANQRSVPVKHIIEFKENLRVLLLSGLFILLAARITLPELLSPGWVTLLFVATMILLIRPVSVFVSTLGSGFSLKERLFLSWVAPRGVVAAAVSAVFGLRLAEEGVAGADLLAPVTFAVIILTVTIYGFTARPLAVALGVAQASPQGVLFVGAHGWARALASALINRGYSVVMADTNSANLYKARMAGIKTYSGNALSEKALNQIDLEGIGKLFAVTGNSEVNSLAALHFAEVFGRSEVYQVANGDQSKDVHDHFPGHLRGRILFDGSATYTALGSVFAAGAEVKSTKLTEEFDLKAFSKLHGGQALNLFLIDGHGDLHVFTERDRPTPGPGHTVISLISNSGSEGKQTPGITGGTQTLALEPVE